MRTSFLDRGEGRIGYDVQGDGPLVLCLPGMGELRSTYRLTVPALVQAGYRVATMDLRGHGDSDDGFTSYDDIALAADTRALIAHLGGPAFIVGNSMGAGGALLAAADEPTAVTGLALIGPFVRDPGFSPLLRLAQRLLLIKPWGPVAWIWYYRSLYPGRPPADLPEHLTRIRASLRRGDHWRSFIQTTRTDHEPVWRRLDEVHAPTLVIMGEKDPDFRDAPAEGRYAAERLNAELLLVPEAGHYPMTEYPEVVNPVLISFLDKVTGRG